jgi:ADP-heptose:LPS heptosyltransferase
VPKFLIIRFSSIGDIVLTTPVIRCVKQQVPGAEIHFLTKKSFKTVTDQNPYIDKFFYYDNNLKELKRELKKENYDYVIDLHKNIRSYLIRFSLWRKTLSYRKLSVEKFLLTKLGINLMPKKHIVRRNLETVFSLGVKDDGNGLDYFIAEKDIVLPEYLPLSHRFGFIAIVIGASYYTKKLPVEKIRELCTKLNHPVILIGGKEEIPEGEQIAAADTIKIYNACGKFNLNQSADLVRKSNLVISHDTGLQYIACAFNKPVLAVWGGTSPMLDVEPYYGKFYTESSGTKFTYQNFIVAGLTCQPCSNYGTKKCPKGHFKCMKLQDIDAIKLIAEKIIGI